MLGLNKIKEELIDDPEDPFRLKRFVSAQDDHAIYYQAVSELWDGLKVSHWVWFVFPQYLRFGLSKNSEYYAIHSVDEAEAYLRHEVLGPRLVASVRVLLYLDHDDIVRTLGMIDAEKLLRCLSLFVMVAERNDDLSDMLPVLKAVLDRFYDGEKEFYTKVMVRSGYAVRAGTEDQVDPVGLF